MREKPSVAPGHVTGGTLSFSGPPRNLPGNLAQWWGGTVRFREALR